VIAAGTIAGCASTSVPRSIVAPEVELVNLTVLGPQRFALTLLISNSNPGPIPVEEVRYSVRLAGQGYLNGRETRSLVLAPSARQTLRIELTTDGVSSAAALLALVRDDSLDYELNGDLVVDSRRERLIPFAFDGEVPFAITAAD
jgi:LEA14-like dessication related protein